jgi:molybdenum cofactor cytidylyltransferase
MTIVVTGDRKTEIEMALDELDIVLTHNQNYRSGIAGSLIAGISVAQADRFDGVLVMLADMPAITTNHLNRLIARFQHEGGGVLVRATSKGIPGNPVLLPSSLFGQIRQLRGDIGAREIIKASGLKIIDIEMGDAACFDVDTSEAVIFARGGFNN